jgi:hypothetical protein
MNTTLRAADRDRDEVVGSLREHYAQGRLTFEEFEERSAAAATARTMGELQALTVDLPPAAATETPEAVWSSSRMRLIAVVGVAATVVLLVGAAVAGHFMLAWPTWLVVLVAVKLAHGRRRMTHVEGPRARRG